MRDKYQKYLKVLKIELEDLEEDLRIMAEIYGEREKRDEITQYVFLENLSLLKQEIAGIEQILHSLDSIEVSNFQSLENMVEHVDSLFRHKTDDADFPEAVYALVKRKLLKVSKYIHSGEDT